MRKRHGSIFRFQRRSVFYKNERLMDRLVDHLGRTIDRTGTFDRGSDRFVQTDLDENFVGAGI